jgi:hypothetical protein
VRERSFRVWVAVLALLRILPALVVLAANGRSLPAFPGYPYGPPTGDTYGFYAAAREFVSAWAHVSRPLLALSVVALGAALVLARRFWRNGSGGVAIALVSVAIGLFIALGVRAMVPTGAGAVGWPIIWSLPMFPLRATGLLSYHVAFYAGIAILLAANVVTVVATALIARRFARPQIALLAPALLVLWPFLMRLVEGTGNVAYGSWLDDQGVALYAEPLSTALVAVAIALVILRAQDERAIAAAGALAGFATAVRISNITIVAVLGLGILLLRNRRAAVLYGIACAGMGAVAAAFWSLGYATFSGGKSEQAPAGLFSWHYLLRSWRDSGVFDWKMLLILLPLPLVGVWALRQHALELVVLGGTVAVTAAFYSAYYITALHPRFLFVALPALFVLVAVGAATLSRTSTLGLAPGEPRTLQKADVHARARAKPPTRP